MSDAPSSHSFPANSARRVAAILPPLAALGILIWLGYQLSWTGFGSSFDADNKEVAAKTLWDWLELLIVPVLLAVGAWYLDGSRKASEAAVEADRQRQKTLDDYFEHMTKILLEFDVKGPTRERLQVVARTRTLAALRALDGARKAEVLQFLYEAGLIGPNPFVNLIGADFRQAQLDEAMLRDAELRGVHFNVASFRNANLDKADLSGSDFSGADFTDATLDGTNLTHALMQRAIITSRQLHSANTDGASLPSDIALVK